MGGSERVGKLVIESIFEEERKSIMRLVIGEIIMGLKGTKFEELKRRD